MRISLFLSNLLPVEVFKVSINDDPGLTLTYFTARSNLAACAFGRRLKGYKTLTESFKL